MHRAGLGDDCARARRCGGRGEPTRTREVARERALAPVPWESISLRVGHEGVIGMLVRRRARARAVAASLAVAGSLLVSVPAQGAAPGTDPSPSAPTEARQDLVADSVDLQAPFVPSVSSSLCKWHLT